MIAGHTILTHINGRLIGGKRRCTHCGLSEDYFGRFPDCVIRWKQVLGDDTYAANAEQIAPRQWHHNRYINAALEMLDIVRERLHAMRVWLDNYYPAKLDEL